MKFSILFLTTGLALHAADCDRSSLAGLYAAGAAHLKLFQNQLGVVGKGLRFPQICVDRKRFHQVKGGRRVKAAYDRLSNTIYLRARKDLESLKHEIAHFYFDQKLGRLTPKVTEALVTCLLWEVDNNPPHEKLKPVRRKDLRGFLAGVQADRDHWCSGVGATMLRMSGREIRSLTR